MRSGRHGFTLIELLAVMAILAVLAGLGVKGYGLARRQAREARATAELEEIRTALEEFRVEFGRYPGAGHDGDISALAEMDRLQRLVEELPVLDPWGRPYQYRHNAGAANRYLYQVWSLGQSPDLDADNIVPSAARHEL